VKVKTGDFLWQTTDVATTPYVLPCTNLGTPKLVRLFMFGSASAVDAVAAGDQKCALGMGSSPTARGGICASVENGQDPTDARGEAFDNAIAVIAQDDAPGNREGALDLDSIDATPGSESVTIIVDQQLAIANHLRIGYQIICSDTLPNIKVGTGRFTTGSPPFTQDFTDPGFNCTYFELWKASYRLNASNTNARIFIGAYDGVTQFFVGNIVFNNQASGVNRSYGRQGDEIYGSLGATGVSPQVGANSFITNGIRFDHKLGSDDADFVYLAVEEGAGDGIEIASFVSQTGTGGFAGPTLGFTPAGCLVLSHCLAESTAITVQSHATFSIGSYDGTTQHAQGVAIQDLADPSRVTVGVEFDALEMRIDEATDTLDGTIAGTALAASSVTLDQTLVPDSQEKIYMVAYEADAVAGGVGIPLVMHHRKMIGGS
jgi:hypothetical protein